MPFRKLRQKAFTAFIREETALHELTYLFWECTARCNLNCLHCGSDCRKESHVPDMPVEDFFSAIDTLPPPNGKITVIFTGGEPLMRSDITEAGRQLRKRGFRWGMVSNGLLYTPEIHNSLLNAGMGSLTFSVDGLEANHNWMRNSRLSFSAVASAIDLVVRSPRINFDIVTCVNSKNINELPELYKFLVSKGVKAWRLFTITPIGRSQQYPELFLNQKQMVSLMNFIVEHRNRKEIDVKFSCEGYTGKYEDKVREGFYFCRAGINIGSVLVDGSISACPNISRDFVQGNIYRDNFADVWAGAFEPFRNRNWTRKGKCAVCPEYNLCLGNGMHWWHSEKDEVLLCHKQYIDQS